MDEEKNELSQARRSVWANLVMSVVKAKEKTEDASTASAVERQTENSRKGGTIWEAVRKADQAAMERLVTENRDFVNARGPVGECPIHMLFLYGSETHLEMARYLFCHFPHTMTQIYNKEVSRRRRS